MFDIRPMPLQIADPLRDRLLRVETATLGHILHTGFVDSAIRAVLPDNRIAGTAVTVQIPGMDSTLLHHALGLTRPGDVLVIDRCGDTRHACWGGVVTQVAKAAGVAAAVIDGPATDFSEIRQHAMPVWCRGPSSLTTKLLGLPSALNVPVTIGGQTVCPGDAVLADESGVVILAAASAEEICGQALAMQAREFLTLARLRAGDLLGDISGANELIRGRSC
ncbi:MAG: 4-hydroxy-4-methyl-2-oxoglutarate aldolase [Rhodospirillales bacterium]|nr:4-hydroxy-4-methyl-2-oxoglutarate aldolase [Rhodospirillales bacterium]